MGRGKITKNASGLTSIQASTIKANTMTISTDLHMDGMVDTSLKSNLSSIFGIVDTHGSSIISLGNLIEQSVLSIDSIEDSITNHVALITANTNLINSHNHDTVYSILGHAHDISYFTKLLSDARYYTQAQCDTKFHDSSDVAILEIQVEDNLSDILMSQVNITANSHKITDLENHLYDQIYDTSEQLLYPDCYNVKSYFDTELANKTLIIHDSVSGNIDEIKLLVSQNIRCIHLNCLKSNNQIYNCRSVYELTGSSTLNLSESNRYDYPVLCGNQRYSQSYIHLIEDYFRDEYLYKNTYFMITDVSQNCYTLLNDLITKYKLKNRVLIASSDETNLDGYVGYRTCYWDTLNRDDVIDKYDLYIIEKDKTLSIMTDVYDDIVQFGVSDVNDIEDFTDLKSSCPNTLSFAMSDCSRHCRYSGINIGWYPNSYCDDVVYSANNTNGVLCSYIADKRVLSVSDMNIITFHGIKFDVAKQIRINIKAGDMSNYGCVSLYLRENDRIEHDNILTRNNSWCVELYANSNDWAMKLYELTGNTKTLKYTDTTAPFPKIIDDIDITIYISSANVIYWNIELKYCNTSFWSHNYDMSGDTVDLTSGFYISHSVKNTVAKIKSYY